jgi:hypothetical protein
VTLGRIPVDDNKDACGALHARITALEKMLNEREERTKERFVFIEKNINIAMASADKAITKSEMAVEKRFDSVNEFRQTLADQAATLLPRAEYSVQHATLVDRVTETISRVASLEERQAGKKEASTDIRETSSDASTRSYAMASFVLSIVSAIIVAAVGVGTIITLLSHR